MYYDLFGGVVSEIENESRVDNYVRTCVNIYVFGSFDTINGNIDLGHK